MLSGLVRATDSDARSHSVRVAMTLRDGGPKVVTLLARELGLSRPTVDQALAELQSRGLVRSVGTVAATRDAGRPARQYALEARYGFQAGVDVGTTSARIVVTDLTGEVLVSRQSELPRSALGQRRVKAVGELISSTVLERGLDLSALQATVCAVPGIVGQDGRIAVSNVIPDWAGYDVAALLAEELPGSIRLENDITLASVAERLVGAGQMARDLVYVSIGRRVAVALTIAGHQHVGVDRTAGHVAHLFGSRIGTAGDLQWDAAAQASEVFARAAAGDPTAAREVDAFICDIATGITALILTINPESVVIGGGFAAVAEPVMDNLRSRVASQIALPARVNICRSHLGAEAVVVGASLVAAEMTAASLFGAVLPAPTLTWLDPLDTPTASNVSAAQAE